MKTRYSLVCRGHRGGTFYAYDSATRRRESLGTRKEHEAKRLINAKNEAIQNSQMNLQIAQIYLQHGNPALSSRTWQMVMDQMTPLKADSTQTRWQHAIRDRAFDLIRGKKLIETTAEHFLAVLNAGTVSTNMFLRRLHNFAMGMHWLPWPIIPKLQWPEVKHKERRAITSAEHHTIIQREYNPEIRAYYQLLWHLGGSQTDIAELKAEDADWKDRTISFRRGKTGVPVIVRFGDEAASLLRSLPSVGSLFPRLARIKENHRAKMFIKRLKTVGITGISLHSYRYAWAERAKTVGMPERFAQQALGHNSKSFVRAYSKRAYVVVPSLEDYENKIVPLRSAVGDETIRKDNLEKPKILVKLTTRKFETISDFISSLRVSRTHRATSCPQFQNSLPASDFGRPFYRSRFPVCKSAILPTHCGFTFRRRRMKIPGPKTSTASKIPDGDSIWTFVQPQRMPGARIIFPEKKMRFNNLGGADDAG